LIPVVGGALIVGVAGLLRTWFRYRLDASRTRTTELRTNLERLVRAAFETEKWLKEQEAHILFREPDPRGDPPQDTIQVLVALYFEELESEATAFLASIREYRRWMLERRTNEPGTSTLPEGWERELDRLYSAYLLRRRDFVDAARRLMREQLHT